MRRMHAPGAAFGALIGLVAALTAGALRAQEAEEPEQPRAGFEERVEVTEVLLDVLVTDPRGNVVLGLGPEDFVVEEDGEPVELTSATFYSNRRFLESSAMAERLGVSPGEVPVDRYFVVFFHDLRRDIPSLLVRQGDAARWLERWVREGLLLNDWVAVVSYDYKLKIHQDFTTDRKAIAQAIEAAVEGKDPGDNWPSRQPGEDQGPSLLRSLPQGKALRRATTRIYSGIELLAEALGDTRGRKNLILFSIGFGNVTDLGQYRRDERYYPPMMRALNDNNVAVYAVDLVPTGRGGGPIEQALNDGLSELANDTGGRFYSEFTSYMTPLTEITEDNNGYYLLSYTSRHPAGESGFQRVRVETTNPGFRVRSREGYAYGDESPAERRARQRR